MTASYDDHYQQWLAYCRNCTNAQVQNVKNDEAARAIVTTGDARTCAMAGVAAARVVMAERGIGDG